MTDFNPFSASAAMASGHLLADRRFVYGQALLKEGDGEGAADLFGQVIELVPDWAPAWLALGDAELIRGRSDAALAAWQRCLDLHPDDLLGAQPRLARLGVGGAGQALGHGYVAALFDEYAERFDRHLTGALDYRAPQILAEALLTEQQRFGRVFDLGCGTGLMAASLRDHADYLAGCDLSAAMVAQARTKGLYHTLACLDGVAALQQEPPGTFDLVVAADVFVYIGDLQPVFAASHAVLASGGLMAFTAQSTESGPVVIGEDLRAAHSRAYLETCAQDAGFAVVRLEAVSVRQDRGQPVPGWLCLLQKP
jgi:predicted TPR repeat methyltransferase